jgi:hypothetical protein
MLASYSPWILLPISVVALAFIFLHTRSVMASSRNLLYADRLIRLERWRLFLFVFTVSSFFVLYATLAALVYLHFNVSQIPAPFNQIMAFLVNWFLFFIILSLTLNLRGFQTPYRMARLCFRATIDELEGIPKQEKARMKDAYRCFRWLRLGFRNCNDFLLKKPYCVMVKNIDIYHQRILSFALVGDETDLNKSLIALREVLASFGNNKDDFDLPSLLIAYQLILGRDMKGKESTHELAEMILAKPSLWERTEAVIKSPDMASVVSIITLVATILAIYFQYLHLF